MLVLSRIAGEKIIIDHPQGLVTLTVLEVRRDGSQWRVRVGIEAPKGMPVWREEVWLQIQAKQEEEKQHDRQGEPRDAVDAQQEGA